jgi:predicted nucleotidyltransferase
MPVRSLNSSVLVWPDRQHIDLEARAWAAAVAQSRTDVRRFGYYGSYARGDWGVVSDLDLVAVIERSELPFERRALAWPLETLPIPAEILIYTTTEWQNVLARDDRFANMLAHEVVWVWP